MTTYARTCAWSSLLLLLLIALPLYLRVVMESRLALEHARQARSSDQVAAIAHYRRAISWDAPFGSSAEIAARELYRFASSETFSQELQTDALRELRSGLYASRNFLVMLNSSQSTWRSEVLDLVDAALTQRAHIRDGQGFKLIHPPRVDFRFQLLSQVFFWAWIGSVVYLIWSSFSSAGQIIWSKLPLRLTGVIFTYSAWLWALAHA